jgi:hypothetical protein
MATYQANHVGFARLMKSDDVSLFVRKEATKLATHLRETAPRSKKKNRNALPYAEQFEVQSGLDIRERDRAAAFVVNKARYATVLEVGNARIKNPPRPMTNALNAFRP